MWEQNSKLTIFLTDIEIPTKQFQLKFLMTILFFRLFLLANSKRVALRVLFGEDLKIYMLLLTIIC